MVLCGYWDVTVLHHAVRRGAGHGQVMDDEQINNDLIEATLALVDRDFEPDGAVLIFLPGLQACGPDAPPPPRLRGS